MRTNIRRCCSGGTGIFALIVSKSASAPPSADSSRTWMSRGAGSAIRISDLHVNIPPVPAAPTGPLRREARGKKQKRNKERERRVEIRNMRHPRLQEEAERGTLFFQRSKFPPIISNGEIDQKKRAPRRGGRPPG